MRTLVLDTAGTSTAQATSFTIESSRYRIDDRFLEMFSEVTKRAGPHVYNQVEKFRPGVLNYALAGVFGMQERRPFSDTGARKIETTTDSAITEGDTQISVADSSEFRAGQVILVRSGTVSGATFSCHAIIQSIGSPNLLNVDPIVLSQAAPSGSQVVTYGHVPEEVQMACVLIVNDRKYGMATEQFRNAQVQSRIRMEQTDNYLYQLDSRSAHTSEANTTGNEEADRLLASYSAPPYLGGV